MLSREVFDRWRWRGYVVVTHVAHDPDCAHVHGARLCTCAAVVVRQQLVRNLIVTAGKNLIRDAMLGAESPRPLYMAVGSGSAAPAAGDVALAAEFTRKAITRSSSGGAGDALNTTYLAPYEANSPKIEELGWFGGHLATGSSGTGALIARVLYSHQKTAQESLQVDRHDTF